MEKLEVRELTIDDLGNLGVHAISFVDNPATNVNFFAFNEEKKYTFNEERRIVTGVAMIPDIPIYRNDNGIEYYVKFSKETIEKIAIKFFKNNFTNNSNMMHDSENKLEGVTLFESFMVDRSRGVQPLTKHEDAIDGTWIVSHKIENNELWESVKQGKFRGFSVEGLFEETKQKEEKQGVLESELNKILEKFVHKYKNGTYYNKTLKTMSVLKQAFEALSTLVNGESKESFAEVELADGTKITSNTESIAVDSVVSMMDTEGVEVPLSGTYELADGTGFVAVEGIVTELIAAPEEVVIEEETMSAENSKHISELKEIVSSLSSKMESFKSENESLKTQLKAMFSVVEILSKEEKTKPTETKTNFSKDNLDKKELRLEELKKSFSQIKK